MTTRMFLQRGVRIEYSGLEAFESGFRVYIEGFWWLIGLTYGEGWWFQALVCLSFDASWEFKG